MNFDQGEFDFHSAQAGDGYRRWRQELDARKREFEARWGVILGRRARVQLIGEHKALEGTVHTVSETHPGTSAKLRLRLRNREFTATEIESIIALDDKE